TPSVVGLPRQAEAGAGSSQVHPDRAIASREEAGRRAGDIRRARATAPALDQQDLRGTRRPSRRDRIVDAEKVAVPQRDDMLGGLQPGPTAGEEVADERLQVAVGEERVGYEWLEATGRARTLGQERRHR